MARIGVFDPATAKTVLEVVRYLKESGFVVPVPGRTPQTITPPTPIYIRNDSGEEIPAFACMQVTGTVEAGGQNYIKVDQPADVTGDAGGYLFNGIAPIADGDYGIAYDGPVARMLTDGSTINCGDAWQPQVNDWEVTTGGIVFTAIGADDIETNVMRGFILPPAPKLYRFTLNGSLAGGTADADILDMNGVDTGVDATVRDPLGIFATLTTVGDPGICVRQGGKYWVIQAPCP